jgi:hypothetical protein
MELVGWYELILIAVQVGYSWLLKKYTALNSKWLPLINFGAATIVWTVTTMQAGHPFAVAIVQGLYNGFLTAIAATGIHSAAKNTVQAIIPETPA